MLTLTSSANRAKPMNALRDGKQPEACFATFEISDSDVDPGSLLAGFALVNLTCLPRAPEGLVWYEMKVSAEPIGRRWAIASAALRAIKQAADSGHFSTFRIIHGDYLIDYRRTQMS